MHRCHFSVGENPTRQGSFQSAGVETALKGRVAEQLLDVKGSFSGIGNHVAGVVVDRVNLQIKQLIRTMSRDNVGWGAPLPRASNSRRNSHVGNQHVASDGSKIPVLLAETTISNVANIS